MFLLIEYPIRPEDITLINYMFLTTNNYNKLFFEEIENMEPLYKDFICGICFCKKKVSKKLRCKHLFCNKCITKWLTECSNNCPLCRTILN